MRVGCEEMRKVREIVREGGREGKREGMLKEGGKG